MEQIEKEIGEAAGRIWEAVQLKGPMPRSRIAKETNLSTQWADRGIGWLAREGKISSEKRKNVEVYKLKE